jgi:hypothetical protein
MTEKQLSPERRRFLQEMGTVAMEGIIGMDVDSDGVVMGAYGKFVPREESEQVPLDRLFGAMRMVGLEPTEFKFQQYRIVVANPHHGLRVDLEFPDQLVIKGYRYQGLHQLDLVLKSPFVAATEIKSYSRSE